MIGFDCLTAAGIIMCGNCCNVGVAGEECRIVGTTCVRFTVVDDLEDLPAVVDCT